MSQNETLNPGDTGVVIVHPTYGIFVGCGMGMAFFSNQECLSLEAAPVLPESVAKEFISSWHSEHGKKLAQEVDMRSCKVNCYVDGAPCANVHALVAAGLAEYVGPFVQNERQRLAAQAQSRGFKNEFTMMH